MDLKEYRESDKEKARSADLLRLLPKGRGTVLDIGARDGYFSRLLTEHFTEVTALDLQKPAFSIARVVTVAGDATKLNFPDESFDCVFCAEVLEHIPDVEKACQEIARVVRHEAIIGVPFKQDTRIGRTTCRSCRRINPPWGHVNSFDESRLLQLFPGLRVISKSLIGSNNERTNSLATLLMDLAGNPWGSYNQDEPCIYCGAPLTPPGRNSFLARCCSSVAIRLTRLQTRITQPHGNWIHLVLSKRP